jgi:YggT family protein
LEAQVHTLIGVFEIILNVASTLILIQVVLSLLISFNVVNRQNQLVYSIDQGLGQLTEPLYRPIRRALPSTGNIDWAPFVALIVIRILLYVLGNWDQSILTGGQYPM